MCHLSSIEACVNAGVDWLSSSVSQRVARGQLVEWVIGTEAWRGQIGLGLNRKLLYIQKITHQVNENMNKPTANRRCSHST